MRVRDLDGKKVIIWGTGREGVAAARFIRRHLPAQKITFVAEEGDGDVVDVDGVKEKLVIEQKAREALLLNADVVIKSPGVSLYYPIFEELKKKNIAVTSLLRLWLAEPKKAKTICVTGTKGKSTTSSLAAHVLNGLGYKTILAGNIGIPITDVNIEDAAYVVVETSSYQAADVEEKIDYALITSLYQDHIDWHGSVANYHRDKLNLLNHADIKIASQQVADISGRKDLLVAGTPTGFHAQENIIFFGTTKIGEVTNPYLARAHNMANMCLVLTLIKALGLDAAQAMRTMEDFKGLPHRQQELGIKNGVLYVDDSIATSPQAAIAAMEHYSARPITLIAGGFDRGIDYTPLTDYLLAKKIANVLVMGPSGDRIFNLLANGKKDGLFKVASMPEAVAMAQKVTPQGGVVLLSPAAPSYGLFKDFVARGLAFAQAIAL